MLKQSPTQDIVQTFKASGLKYQEVYEELQDHYTAAIEEKMHEHHSFEEAMKLVHQNFGGKEGLKHIEKRFYKQLFLQYRHLQWQHFKQQFRWPQTSTCLVIGLLVYILAYLLNDTRIIKIATGVIALLPLILIGITYKHFLKRSTYSKYTAKGMALVNLSFFSASVLNFFNFFPNIFFGDRANQGQEINILALYPAALSVILTFYILYLLSFIRSMEQVKPSIH